MRQSRFQGEVGKNIDFRDPFYFDFGSFWMPRGVKKFTSLSPLSALFRSWGLSLFCLLYTSDAAARCRGAERKAAVRLSGQPKRCVGRVRPCLAGQRPATKLLTEQSEFTNCCSLTRGPPHSTTPLVLADVRRIDRNLGGFCQNLERTLPISARILATKCNCVCEFQC